MPETGIPRQKTGKWQRYQRILYWQNEVICFRQEEPGRIQGWNAHGTVWCRVKETCLFFMPKELQYKNKIKAVQENQLSHDIKEFTDSFKKVENSKRSDKMWETGNINRKPVSCDNSGIEEQINYWGNLKTGKRNIQKG